MPNWFAPLHRARRDNPNGYIICIHRSPNERDMHRTSCGSSGTHIRPRGDMLAHRMPCVHDTSSIPEKHFLMNHTPPCVQHKNSRAHNPSKPPPTDPYIGNRPWDPPSSHPDERRRERRQPWIGRPTGRPTPL
jgi:hypothetical protein